jgi:hypothetical protein
MKYSRTHGAAWAIKQVSADVEKEISEKRTIEAEGANKMKTVEFKFDVGQEVKVESLFGGEDTGIVIKCGFDGEGFSYFVQTKHGEIWYSEQFLKS